MCPCEELACREGLVVGRGAWEETRVGVPGVAVGAVNGLRVEWGGYFQAKFGDFLDWEMCSSWSDGWMWQGHGVTVHGVMERVNEALVAWGGKLDGGHGWAESWEAV
jgi:hypothetical protein